MRALQNTPGVKPLKSCCRQATQAPRVLAHHVFEISRLLNVDCKQHRPNLASVLCYNFSGGVDIWRAGRPHESPRVEPEHTPAPAMPAPLCNCVSRWQREELPQGSRVVRTGGGSHGRNGEHNMVLRFVAETRRCSLFSDVSPTEWNLRNMVSMKVQKNPSV